MRERASLAAIFCVSLLLGRFPAQSGRCLGNPFEQPKQQSYSCTQTVINGDKTGPSSKYMVLSPGHVRTEGPGFMVGINDFQQGKSLSLNSITKTGIMFEAPQATTQRLVQEPPDFLVSILRTAQALGKAAPGKQIGGTDAVGLLIDQAPLEGVVYIDPQTQLPLEFDIKDPGRKQTSIYNNFDFNVVFDPALFSMTVPPGYRVRIFDPQMNADSVEDVAAMLQAYTKKSGGNFPPDLLDLGKIAPVILKGAKRSTQPSQIDADRIGIMMEFAQAQIKLRSLHRGSEWDYFPGIRFGDHSKIVFWLRLKNADSFEVIRGDLQVETAGKDQLPAEHSPTSQPG